MTLTKELQFAARVSSQPGLGTFCTVFVPFASAVAHPGSVLWQLVKFPLFMHTPKITWLLWRERRRGTRASVEWNDLTHFEQSARQDALRKTAYMCESYMLWSSLVCCHPFLPFMTGKDTHLAGKGGRTCRNRACGLLWCSSGSQGQKQPVPPGAGVVESQVLVFQHVCWLSALKP